MVPNLRECLNFLGGVGVELNVMLKVMDEVEVVLEEALEGVEVL